MSQPRFRYQEQDTPMTLREGYEEYLTGHPGLFREDQMEPASREMFHRHDLCHVLFGLDTVPRDEGRADLWTMMATDVGYRRYVGYLRLPEAKAAFASVSRWRLALLFVLSLGDAIAIFVRTRRMRRKLDWDRLEEHLDRSLAELRRDYGLRLLR